MGLKARPPRRRRKAKKKPLIEMSAFRCWDCGHTWYAPSTIRGRAVFSSCVDECPECGSETYEEHFPDGATIKPYVRPGEVGRQ
jgi:hypothetical protein